MKFVFDELNNLQERIRMLFDDEQLSKMPILERVYLCEDIIEEMLIYAWTVGEIDFYNELGIDGSEAKSFPTELQRALEYKIDGKNYADRVREYATIGDTTALNKVAETETTRLYNEAKYVCAKAFEPIANSQGFDIVKTWVTMGDERVRDTHSFLNGLSVPLDTEFWSFDGDHALKPGGFTLPQNNINCRCYVVYGISSRETR